MSSKSRFVDGAVIDGMADRAKRIVYPLAAIALGLAAWATYTCRPRGFWGDLLALLIGDRCR